MRRYMIAIKWQARVCNIQILLKQGEKHLAKKLLKPIFAAHCERPVRLRARTPPFHGGDTGSNPVRATKDPFMVIKSLQIHAGIFVYRTCTKYMVSLQLLRLK